MICSFCTARIPINRKTVKIRAIADSVEGDKVSRDVHMILTCPHCREEYFTLVFEDEWTSNRLCWHEMQRVKPKESK